MFSTKSVSVGIDIRYSLIPLIKLSQQTRKPMLKQRKNTQVSCLVGRNKLSRDLNDFGKVCISRGNQLFDDSNSSKLDGWLSVPPSVLSSMCVSKILGFDVYVSYTLHRGSLIFSVSDGTHTVYLNRYSMLFLNFSIVHLLNKRRNVKFKNF